MSDSTRSMYNLLSNREIYGHQSWNRDRHPRFNGPYSSKLGGLEYLVRRLQQSVSFECHDGCINTVRWNYDGTLVVSGGDDCVLGVYRPRPHYEQEAQLCYKFESSHTRNIFHALFVPHTNDDDIVSCALDCDIRYNILSKQVSNRIGTHAKACHKLDIIDPFTFLSCSEDGSIKIIDLRDEKTVNNTNDHNKVHNTMIQLTGIESNATNTSSIVTLFNKNKNDSDIGINTNNHAVMLAPKLTKTTVACYTMTLNPMNNNILGVGCRDQWVRLYDRRTLSTNNHGKNAKPFCLLTQHHIIHKKDPSSSEESEGVTGLAWSYDGKEIVATFSSRSIALFDLYESRTCYDMNNCGKCIKACEQERKQEENWIDSLDIAQSDDNHTDNDNNDSANENENENENENTIENTNENEMNDGSINANDDNNNCIDLILEDEKSDNSKENNKFKKRRSLSESQSTDQNNSVLINKDEINMLNQNQNENDNDSDNNNNDSDNDDIDTIDNSNENNNQDRPNKRRKLNHENSLSLSNEDYKDETGLFEAFLNENSNENDSVNNENNNYDDLNDDIEMLIGSNNENESILQNEHRKEEILNHQSNRRNRMKQAVSKVKGIIGGIKNVKNNMLQNNHQNQDNYHILSDNDTNNNNDNSLRLSMSPRIVSLKNNAVKIAKSAKNVSKNVSHSIVSKMKRGQKLGPLILNSKRSKAIQRWLSNDSDSNSLAYSLEMKLFKGHRTVETVKECNFFGPRSEYVISGSDCGHCFIWRKSDSKIVNLLKGDSAICNVVQGNPINCSLVTSGLDDTVKFFTPSADNENEMSNLSQIIDKNEKGDTDSHFLPLSYRMLLYLYQNNLLTFNDSSDDDDALIRRIERKENDDNSDDNNDTNDDDDDDDIIINNQNNNIISSTIDVIYEENEENEENDDNNDNSLNDND